MSRNLPAFPNLDHLRKQAKEHLRELQRHNLGAKLAEAQHAIAREYGFASWPALKAHVESPPPATSAALVALDGAASHTGLYGHARPVESLEDLCYTEKARGALFHARLEADQRWSPRIEPEHVLLGLIHRYYDSARREGRDLPGRIFARSHLSVETVRNEIERRVQERAPTPQEMPFGSQSNRGLQTLPRKPNVSGATLTEEFKKRIPQREVPFSSPTKRLLHHAAEEGIMWGTRPSAPRTSYSASCASRIR